MTLRPFRFGIQLFSTCSRALWQDLARQAEDLGYDVIQVADHLGRPAPFPALVSAADVTTRPRLGTMVLNASFYTPAVLARDAREPISSSTAGWSSASERLSSTRVVVACCGLLR